MAGLLMSEAAPTGTTRQAGSTQRGRPRPPAIVTVVRFDYTNYDAEPPSVRLIDPFSGRCVLDKELPIRLPRVTGGQEVALPVPGAPMMQVRMTQDLMQAHSPDVRP